MRRFCPCVFSNHIYVEDISCSKQFVICQICQNKLCTRNSRRYFIVIWPNFICHSPICFMRIRLCMIRLTWWVDDDMEIHVECVRNRFYSCFIPVDPSQRCTIDQLEPFLCTVCNWSTHGDSSPTWRAGVIQLELFLTIDLSRFHCHCCLLAVSYVYWEIGFAVVVSHSDCTSSLAVVEWFITFVRSVVDGFNCYVFLYLFCRHGISSKVLCRLFSSILLSSSQGFHLNITVLYILNVAWTWCYLRYASGSFGLAVSPPIGCLSHYIKYANSRIAARMRQQ